MTGVKVVGRLAARSEEWKRMGANLVVLKWVKDGVELGVEEGKVFVDQREFPCTSEQKEWILKELARLLAVEAIEEVMPGQERKVRHVSPIFVVPKKGPKKYRLVIDLRGLNQGLPDWQVRFEGLSTLARIAGKGWWMCTFDLAQGYHHVLMTEQASQWLGFRFAGRLFCYRVLPFGLKWAPWIFTKIVREMVRVLRGKGVHLMVYIDDFCILAPTREELLRVRDLVIAPLLETLGWIQEPEKGCWEPTQVTEVLGLLVDLKEGRFIIPERKVIAIQRLLRKKMGMGCCTRRTLARLCGIINSVMKAVPVLRIYLRECYRLIGCMEDKNWERIVNLSQEVKDDWRWILENISKVNGARMWLPSQVVEVFSDACDDGWGGTSQGRMARGSFTIEQAAWHIMFKEMMAVLLVLQSLAHFLRGRRLAIKSDNTTVVAYLRNGGGPHTDLNRMAKQIQVFVMQDLKGEIVSVDWVKGSTDNQEADAMSRAVDCDDWRIVPEIFRRLQKRWGCTVDRFADNLNACLPRFNSRFWCPGAEAVDAFQQHWGNEVNWLLPPLILLHRVIRQVVEQSAVGVLICPRWEAQPWWPMLKGIIVEGMPLGTALEVFISGPSGQVEPMKGKDWEFWAVLIDGRRVSHWASG